MKWNWLPPFVPVERALSKPYAQSIPISPTIGRKMRTPTPAERFMSKGLNLLVSYYAFPPSRNPRP